jgi:hypothetical protein
MTVLIQQKDGVFLSMSHIRTIEHVRGDYSFVFHSDGLARPQVVVEYAIAKMEVKVDP